MKKKLKQRPGGLEKNFTRPLTNDFTCTRYFICIRPVDSMKAYLNILTHLVLGEVGGSWGKLGEVGGGWATPHKTHFIPMNFPVKMVVVI